MKKFFLIKRNIYLLIGVGIVFVALIVAGTVFLKHTKKRRPVIFRPKIAIVIDDWGYTDKNISFIKELPQKINLAILPNLPFSRVVAETALRQKKEVILHLPMQPENDEYLGLEPDTITVSMNSDKIKQIILSDLNSVGLAKGISNHMGSRVTSDKRTLKIIFNELKKRKLYFLDSYVTDKSVAIQLAKEMKIKFARRSVFLDNKQEDKYIINQLVELAKKAKLYGVAIGIGHEYPLTLKILKDYLPRLEKEGFEFVLISKILK